MAADEKRSDVPHPLTTYRGYLRQLNDESVNQSGMAMLKVCVPYFFEIAPQYSDEEIENLKREFPDSVTHIMIMNRQFRRWSGDMMAPGANPQLPRRRYFSLCADSTGDDGGTIVEELNAYRNLHDDIDIEFVDLMRPDVAEALRVPVSPDVLLVVKDARSLEFALPSFPPALQDMVTACAEAGKPFFMTLGTMIGNAEIEGVLDLRLPATQAWFFDHYVQGIIKTPATRFEDILPELLNLALGGSTPENSRLQAIGDSFRRLGISALIYPSARKDPEVYYRDGELVAWHGWNMVLYDQAPPGSGLFVDLGGWETKFPPIVRLEERAPDADGIHGWRVSGITSVNRQLYSIRRKDAEFGIDKRPD